MVTQAPRIPRPYAAIAADPGRRAVLEIPLQWRTGFGDFGDVHSDHSIFLYYATRHGKPVANGMVARYPKRSRQAVLDNPIYAQVVPLQEGEPGSWPPSTSWTCARPASATSSITAMRGGRPRWPI